MRDASLRLLHDSLGSPANPPWSAFAAEPALNSLTAGNRVRVLRDGREALPSMFSAIRTAQRHIHLEYYVLENVHCEGESLGDLLIERRRAGVHIAIIYDSLGSSSTPRIFFRTLQDHGVQLLQFNPLNPLKARSRHSLNRRDHRKILIVDGLLAIVGGMNMSLAYEEAAKGSACGELGASRPDARRWRDTDLELHGPAIAQLQRLFLDHWTQNGGEPLDDVGFFPQPERPGTELVGIIGSAPYQPGPCYYNALLVALRTAERRVLITAGYFLPTATQMRALMRAARRGIDVQLLLPSHNDSIAALAVQRSTYAGLLRSGVRIFERNEVMLHSKSIVIDHHWSFVGSSNFDYRSAVLNDEVDALVVGTNTAGSLSRLFAEDISQSREIDLVRWRQRPLLQRIQERFFNCCQRLL